MKKIFQATEIKGMKLANRLVRSATWEGMCDPDGRPTGKLTNCYVDLARGGVGLIITGYTFVRREGKQMYGMMGLHRDDFATEMKAMVDAVHAEGGKLCVQLVHTGGQTKADAAGTQPLAPSAVAAEQYAGVMPREMSLKDIEEVIASFADAARRGKEYGFDAVQLHAAHGYLICQFLSPLTNRRTDAYGGTVENRCRFLMDVYEAVRKEVGDDYPVLVKLNGSDNIEGGLLLEDAVVAARMLEAAGIDAIEVSGGTPGSGEMTPVRRKINSPEAEAFNLTEALEIKHAVSCPVMVVGGFRSIEKVEEALADVDYISLSRPLIREPDLPSRWQGGDRSPATCISCNKCYVGGLKGEGIYCYVERRKQHKADEDAQG